MPSVRGEKEWLWRESSQELVADDLLRRSPATNPIMQRLAPHFNA